MRESFCITCNRVTLHSRKGCDVCKRPNEQKQEYTIPPTNQVKHVDKINAQNTKETQNTGIRAEGFISPTHITEAMSKTTPTIDINSLSKKQLVEAVANLPASQKLRLFSQNVEERVIPENLEKQDFLELKRTKKGATIVSYVTKNNYNYLTGHEMMRYFKPQPNEEHPEMTSTRGNMFVAEDKIKDVIDAFTAIGTPVYWRTRTVAKSDNIPTPAE